MSRDLGVLHRNYVAHNANFETGLTVFQVLLEQGLKSTDKVCDIGCGSLRVGRYLLTHLEHGCYYAIEPNLWLVEAAIDNEIGTLWEVKEAAFQCRDDFDVAAAYPDEQVFDWILISSGLAHASHAQMKKALSNIAYTKHMLFDTVPNGSADHTGDYWMYPQVASHYDMCVYDAKPEKGLLTKLHLGTFGEQWWRLDNV